MVEVGWWFPRRKYGFIVTFYGFVFGGVSIIKSVNLINSEFKKTDFVVGWRGSTAIHIHWSQMVYGPKVWFHRFSQLTDQFLRYCSITLHWRLQNVQGKVEVNKLLTVSTVATAELLFIGPSCPLNFLLLVVSVVVDVRFHGFISWNAAVLNRTLKYWSHFVR